MGTFHPSMAGSLRFTIEAYAVFERFSGQFRPIDFGLNHFDLVHVHLSELEFA